MHGEATELPELMTVAEVATLWRQRRETIYRKVRSGEIRAVRLGNETAALRIPRDEVERDHEISAMGRGQIRRCPRRARWDLQLCGSRARRGSRGQ
jgi:excisionase family DNA binding protein